MMAKQNKTLKIKRNNKTKTNKLKGGSSSGLLRTTAQSMNQKRYSLNSVAKPPSEVLENGALEKITEQLKKTLREGQRSNGNGNGNGSNSGNKDETEKAEGNESGENIKPENTKGNDSINLKMKSPPNHSLGKTLGFGLGVGIITGSVILATSH